jgi:hypothetical protein
VPVPIPSLLSFNPVLPKVTWSVAVGFDTFAKGPVAHDGKSVAPTSTAVPFIKSRLVIPFIPNIKLLNMILGNNFSVVLFVFYLN